MSEHPILARIGRESFTPLAWFEPGAGDGLPPPTRFVILIGNAGPQMFARFARERATATLDEWTRATVGRLARDLDAAALYPFDTPHPPFLSWARRHGGGHVSPLGLNIHPRYGLWHAYRAALTFSAAFDIAPQNPGAHPCEACAEKPCLTACPAGAFTTRGFDVPACAAHIASAQGEDCMALGCRARRACPVGQAFTYAPEQAQFHMRAFRSAHGQIGGDTR